MKRFLLILTILALLLTGCGGEPDNTETTIAIPETTVPETTEAPGLYDPDFRLEGESFDALRLYPLGRGTCSGMAYMGEDLLLFFTGDSTTLSLVTGEKLSAVAEADLDCLIFPGEAGTVVKEDGVVYYDSIDNALVTLDGLLQEVSRVQLPDDLEDMPAISPDGNTVYYGAEGEIRALDLQSGISRLLREQPAQRMTMYGLYCGGTVLEAYVETAEEPGQTMYFSTVNGEILHSGSTVYLLNTLSDRYYAECGTEKGLERLFGRTGDQVQVLEPADDAGWTAWLPERHGAVCCALTDGRWVLDHYDLNTGLRTASLSLPDTGTVCSITEDPFSGDVWFLYHDDGVSQPVLCRWDPEKSAVSDDEVYTGRRYTAEDPDAEGLEACRQEARRVGEKYGVEIRLWTDALETAPWDYTLEAEYRVRSVKKALETLDAAMARFPENFFRTAAANSDSGSICIGLVGGIYGDNAQGTLSSAEGVQYWIGNDPYICLVTGDALEQNFYHELCHVLESRVISETVLYDEWEDLNPRGFAYDYDYVKNLERTDSTYLEGEDRAFIDFYSMSYPKEDRARLMEYAMKADQADVFAADRMQRKLRRLCQGIREAFGLEEYPEILPWEQYLEKPLVP